MKYEHRPLDINGVPFAETFTAAELRRLMFWRYLRAEGLHEPLATRRASSAAWHFDDVLARADRIDGVLA